MVSSEHPFGANVFFFPLAAFSPSLARRAQQFLRTRRVTDTRMTSRFTLSRSTPLGAPARFIWTDGGCHERGTRLVGGYIWMYHIRARSPEDVFTRGRFHPDPRRKRSHSAPLPAHNPRRYLIKLPAAGSDKYIKEDKGPEAGDRYKKAKYGGPDSDDEAPGEAECTRRKESRRRRGHRQRAQRRGRPSQLRLTRHVRPRAPQSAAPQDVR